MPANPLTVPIIRILRAHPQGLSEYQLLSQLQFEGLRLEEDPSITADLLLFRKHFLIMNALYRLQPLFWEEGRYLQISALHIGLQSLPNISSETLPDPSGEQPLRDYYLDWNEFAQSSGESVERLLEGFWQRYFAQDQRLEALALFGLQADSSWSEIRSAYRRQAAIHHPDRGGDTEQFCRVRDAYELLACCRG